MSYAEFLASKTIVDPDTGLREIPSIPSLLKDFQADITRWALRRGRAAVFAGTGLGKTIIEDVWCHAIAEHTDKPALIFTPLAVGPQFVREGLKFHLPVEQVQSQADIPEGAGVYVTNYEKLEHFDLSKFGAVVLDESSILKSVDGKTRTHLIESCKQIPFRLAASATPAPNDFMELGNHAEFLGVMSYTDMLATFFMHDSGETQAWRLRGHAEQPFWRWMSSWAVALRKPSDLGYCDDGYNLPPLCQIEHRVDVEYAPSNDSGLLFPMEALSLSERLGARRGSIKERVAKAAEIVFGEMRKCEQKNRHVSTTENITLPTKSPELSNSKSGTMLGAESDTPRSQNSEKNIKPKVEAATKSPSVMGGSNRRSESQPPNTTRYLEHRMAAAPSVPDANLIAEDGACTSTIATKVALSWDCSAAIATLGSGNSRTTPTILPAQSNTCGMRVDPWIIWCQLNREQELLEGIFGDAAFSVHGSLPEREKERRIIAWCAGERPIMISKPSICGYGLNLQHCSNMVFVGLNDSFEQIYQAVRRCWRFGQTKQVNAHFIAAETEGAVVANIRRKEQQADHMLSSMIAHMRDLNSAAIHGMTRDRASYIPKQKMGTPSWLTT